MQSRPDNPRNVSYSYRVRGRGVRYYWIQWVNKRTARLMRRTFVLLVIAAVVFTFFFEYDSREEEEIRFVRRQDIKTHPIYGRKEHRDPRTWLGWSGMTQIFAFGDSQIATGFKTNGPQPDTTNPIGNPAWPGRTASYGPNLIGHMTASYNKSFIRTYNFAIGGSPFEPGLSKDAPLSLCEQIDQRFIATYGRSKRAVSAMNPRGKGSWGRRTSLFVLYEGSDNLLFEFRARGGGRNDTLVGIHMEEYGRCMDKLYQAGARNFLVVNYPSLEKSPFIRTSGIIDAQFDIGAEIVQYNGRLAFTAHRFAERHTDANVFVLDNHKMTLEIREAPARFDETKTIVRIEGFCFPYTEHLSGGVDDVFDERCGVPLSAWFWRDDTHHTEPTERLLAKNAVELLLDPTQRLPMEFY